MYKMVDFAEFQEDLRAELIAEMPEGYLLKEDEVVKNGIVKHGISLVHGTDAAPIMYYEDLYEWYVEQKDAEAAIRDIVVNILIISIPPEPAISQTATDSIVQMMQDKKYVLQNVRYRFSAAGSETMYGDCVMKMWLDIPVLFYVKIKTEGFEGYIRMTKSMFSKLGLSFEIIDAAAARNSQDLNAYICPLSDKTGTLDALMNESTFMLFYGNEANYGAADIIASNQIKLFARGLGSNFYLIPSSVHEWLVLPEYHDIDVASLNAMVRDVNNEDVKPEERLSDHVYFLNCRTGEISIPPED